MNKEFTPYEEALALKELGFDEPCFSIYYSKDKSFSWHHHKDHTNNEPVLDTGEFNISAPTYQQAFRWFRDEYKINGEVNYLPNIEKYGSITSDMNIKPKDLSKNENFKRGLKVTNGYVKYDTYEEAELACLKKLIDLVNQNKDDE